MTLANNADASAAATVKAAPRRRKQNRQKLPYPRTNTALSTAATKPNTADHAPRGKTTAASMHSTAVGNAAVAIPNPRVISTVSSRLLKCLNNTHQ